MNVVFSLILLAAALGCIVFLLTRRENARRSQYGPSGLSEFRTDLPLDDCFDRLDQHSPDDLFAYECRRENDGGFTPSRSSASTAALSATKANASATCRKARCPWRWPA